MAENNSTEQRPAPRNRFENLLLALLEQKAGAEEVWSYPIAAIIDPSSACNLRCPFCFQADNPDARSKAVMEWDLFKKLIDEIGPYLYHCDLFNWGEPFLNRRIFDMIELVKSNDTEIRISTNFNRRLTDEELERLIDSKLDILTVSLDGISQETYSKYRVGGDISIVLDNMRRLKRLKYLKKSHKPRVDWQFLVFSHNEHEMKKAADLACELDADLRFAAPFVYSREWLSSDPRFVRDEYKKKEAAPENAKETDPLEKRIKKLRSNEKHHCDWLYLNLTVNACGTVSPCCTVSEESLDFGDLNTESFRALWNNQKFRAARRIMSGCDRRAASGDSLVCRKCPIPHQQKDFQSYAARAVAAASKNEQQRAAEMLVDYRQPSATSSLFWRSKNDFENIFSILPFSVRELVRHRLRHYLIQGESAKKIVPLIRKIIF